MVLLRLLCCRRALDVVYPTELTLRMRTRVVCMQNRKGGRLIQRNSKVVFFPLYFP